MDPLDRTDGIDAEKTTLHQALQEQREAVLAKLQGLADADRRRPMTPTATNLLGIVKHLASGEFGYLGDSLGRPRDPQLPWVADGSVWDNADMWATAEESTEEVVGLYREAWAHSDRTIAELPLDASARVPWWPAERAVTDLRTLLVRVLVDTARHAGQADVVRELVDGRAGDDRDDLGDDAWWASHHARVAAAAEARSRGGTGSR